MFNCVLYETLLGPYMSTCDFQELITHPNDFQNSTLHIINNNHKHVHCIVFLIVCVTLLFQFFSYKNYKECSKIGCQEKGNIAH